MPCKATPAKALRIRRILILNAPGNLGRVDGKNQNKGLNSSCCVLAYKEAAIEAQRSRTEESKGRKHQDPIGDRGHASMTHDNLVHEAIRIHHGSNKCS